MLGGSLLGAGGSIFGATQAAEAQTSAMKQAMKMQMDMYKRGRKDLKPWMKGGQEAWRNFLGQIPGLTQKFNPTIADLENTPGYKFTLDQGLKSVQNSYAAKGLGTSGAAMKGASEYATGLANQTWKDQMMAHLGQNQQIYNMLQGPATMGQNAAAGLGQMGMGHAQSMGNYLTGMGNAQAGMWGGIANALNGLGGSIPFAFYPGMFGGSGGGKPMSILP
jgi:hypothetical protein